MEMQIIEKYFGDRLTDTQRRQFAALGALYSEWNARINVISRKDIDELYLKHVLHSLAIARVCGFASGARVCDVGCGGGFPSVPLAIMFPEAKFTAVDSIGKKIRVVDEVCKGAGITNVKTFNGRVEACSQRFDYVVCRAVTEMGRFLQWTLPKVERGQCGSLPNGIICLKGGDLAEELAATGRRFDIFAISEYFEEDFFETKKVVYLKK